MGRHGVWGVGKAGMCEGIGGEELAEFVVEPGGGDAKEDGEGDGGGEGDCEDGGDGDGAAVGEAIEEASGVMEEDAADGGDGCGDGEEGGDPVRPVIEEVGYHGWGKCDGGRWDVQGVRVGVWGWGNRNAHGDPWA